MSPFLTGSCQYMVARLEGSMTGVALAKHKDNQMRPVRDERGTVVGIVPEAVDVTGRRQAEEALRQAQKMEAIGQITGGVAHDFNNLLQIIVGNLYLLESRVTKGNFSEADLHRLIQGATRGAKRAATLTQRLLAFARRQPLDPHSLEVNRLVTRMSELLRNTLGESIRIETVLAAGLWRIFSDSSEFENALLNLAVNARDAMPEGGRLTIETANVYIDDAYAAAAEEVTPGQYVMIAVSDTGSGMTKEVIAKAFEPFFTTKDTGQGTGLGLSQVYGFVKQSGGHVRIYSELNEGTTVKIYMPRLVDESLRNRNQPAQSPLPTATEEELILVVEDDEDVRSNTTTMLNELGYRVLEAPDGPQALRILESRSDIDLLFTDVGLPGGINGRQLADHALAHNPISECCLPVAMPATPSCITDVSILASICSLNPSRLPNWRAKSARSSNLTDRIGMCQGSNLIPAVLLREWQASNCLMPIFTLRSG